MIDTHTHFYDPTRPQGIPWPNEDNALLYRTVLPEHFKALARPHGVTGTVVVEASVWLDDNDWILDIAKDEPAIVGFIGNVNPEQEGFETHLDRLARNPLFRGIRLRHGGILKIDLRDVSNALRALADRDLALDLLVNADQLESLAGVANDIPDLRIVIDHTAHVVVDGKAADRAWVGGLEAIAPQANVFMKVSAMVERAAEQPAPTDPEYYRPTLDAMYDILGEDRLLYGSNWPVCERAASYDTVFQIVDSYFTEKGTAARKKYFVENGRRAYKWQTR